MKISVKGRYALAAMSILAKRQQTGDPVTVLSLSHTLGISKIYLEQVFSLLRRGELVIATKGAQGGYLLGRSPDAITAYDILKAVELPLFEQAGSTIADSAHSVEWAMRSLVFDPLDRAIEAALSQCTLQDLAVESERAERQQDPMYYI